MTVADYLRAKEERTKSEWQPRVQCVQCKNPAPICYCAALQPVPTQTQFVILMHPVEVYKTVATGRMAHLSLPTSHLIEGYDFTHHPRVNALIENPANYCAVLTPGLQSVNLSLIEPNKRLALFPSDRQLVIFVIDGTWSQARRMKRLSLNLKKLPQLCFSKPTLSQFKVRKQPAEHCFSTIEAIQTCIELLDPQREQKASLLTAFEYMVEKQLKYKSQQSWRHKVLKEPRA